MQEGSSGLYSRTTALFSIYKQLSNVAFHFYTDDPIIYCAFPSLVQTTGFLQAAFDVVQSNLMELKLVLDGDKARLVLFSNGKEMSKLPKIKTIQGVEIE